jgi:hypothetical protein
MKTRRCRVNMEVEVWIEDGEEARVIGVFDNRMYEITNAGRLMDRHGRTVLDDPIVREAMRREPAPAPLFMAEGE